MLETFAIAQINVTVGDIEGNAGRILKSRAEASGASLVIYPEMALCGYPPEDLVLRPAFRAACRAKVEQLALETVRGPAMLIGSVWEENATVHNAALLLTEGHIQHIQFKRTLPNYGIFDEKRVFTPGPLPQPIRFQGQSLGILVCEDAWTDEVPSALAKHQLQAMIIINASPYETGKPIRREAMVRKITQMAHCPIIYANLIGGQDDLIFDGGSFVLDAEGYYHAQWPRFKEQVAELAHSPHVTELPREQEIWEALCVGLRDYVQKNHFKGVLLGLSGGIDSALAATLAVDALGSENVLGVLLPSAITSAESNEDAEALASALGIKTQKIPIAPVFDAYGKALGPQWERWREDLLVGGNVQSRTRNVILMALSNATGRMLVSTSNKSEVAVGYATLYGDTCGGYAPLKDIYKTDIYALARWRNSVKAVIPERSLTKAPTAELAPGQTDEEQLAPYATLDTILKYYVEGGKDVDAIVKAGFERPLVERILKLVRGAEYKRRQMPPGAKVSPMVFGRDWRYPLTNGFKG